LQENYQGKREEQADLEKFKVRLNSSTMLKNSQLVSLMLVGNFKCITFDCILLTAYTDYSPVQVFPFPEYPALHLRVWDPMILLQTALTSQL